MYIATYVIDIAALFCLIWLLHSSTALNHQRKKPFLIAIILTILIIVSEVGTIYMSHEYLDVRSLNILSNLLGFALAPMIPMIITLIFNHRVLTSHKIFLIPTLINLFATILSPAFRFIFYVDANNQYMRGDYFFIFIAVYIFNFLFLAYSTLKVGKQYNYPMMRKMVVLSVFTIIGTSIQLVIPSAYSSWHCVTLALFLYFLVMSEFDGSFDTLTGLYNRATFDKIAKEMIRTTEFSVIILDINNFKDVNDTYGHDYGDKVIKAVASMIKESFSKDFTCYRFGGDEFSILSKETNLEKIESHLKTMTNALSEFRETGKPIPTVSYGYSICHKEQEMKFYDCLKEADDQMYRYKKAFKNNTTLD